MAQSIKKKKLVTFCVPVFNESANIDRLAQRLISFADTQSCEFDFEFLFTDNSSSDDTFDKLVKLSETDDRFRVLRLSRNFGFQRSILINYLNARGDALIQIDADLQDPPELADEFLKHWQDGYNVVYGVRRNRRENYFLKSLRRLGYSIIDWLSEYPVPRNAGDFRLLDKIVVEALSRYNDQKPYLRGIISSLGFKSIGVEYDRSQREAGESKFGLSKLFALGFDGVFSTSMVPLKIATIIGLAALFVTVLGILYYLFLYMSGVEFQLGIVSLHLLVLGSVGVNSMLLSIFGSYLGRIYLNTRGGPIAVVEESSDAATRID